MNIINIRNLGDLLRIKQFSWIFGSWAKFSILTIFMEIFLAVVNILKSKMIFLIYKAFLDSKYKCTKQKITVPSF